jgi:hypothetical protein
MRSAYGRVIAGLVVAAAALAWSGSPTAGQAPAAKAVVKWEYKSTSVRIGPLTDESLNKYGEDGWELVAVATVPNKVEVVYYFKRPK